MADIGSFLAGVIEWALVPLVLVLLWVYGFAQLPDEATSETAKKASRAARWAGLVVFVLFILWRSGRGDAFVGTMPDYNFKLSAWAFIVLGAICGFWSSRFVDVLKGTKVFPFFTLALVALMSTALYTYTFIWSSRVVILFISLGFALGILLCRAFFSLKAETPPDRAAEQ